MKLVSFLGFSSLIFVLITADRPHSGDFHDLESHHSFSVRAGGNFHRRSHNLGQLLEAEGPASLVQVRGNCGLDDTCQEGEKSPAGNPRCVKKHNAQFGGEWLCLTPEQADEYARPIGQNAINRQAVHQGADAYEPGHGEIRAVDDHTPPRTPENNYNGFRVQVDQKDILGHDIKPPYYDDDAQKHQLPTKQRKANNKAEDGNTPTAMAVYEGTNSPIDGKPLPVSDAYDIVRDALMEKENLLVDMSKGTRLASFLRDGGRAVAKNEAYKKELEKYIGNLFVMSGGAHRLTEEQYAEHSELAREMMKQFEEGDMDVDIHSLIGQSGGGHRTQEDNQKIQNFYADIEGDLDAALTAARESRVKAENESEEAKAQAQEWLNAATERLVKWRQFKSEALLHVGESNAHLQAHGERPEPCGENGTGGTCPPSKCDDGYCRDEHHE